MPTRPQVPCKHNGCSELINPGGTYCNKHKLQSNKDYRINRPDDSSYSTYKWQQIGKQVLIDKQAWNSTQLRFPVKMKGLPAVKKKPLKVKAL
jgi:hypothetical protein